MFIKLDMYMDMYMLQLCAGLDSHIMVFIYGEYSPLLSETKEHRDASVLKLRFYFHYN